MPNAAASAGCTVVSETGWQSSWGFPVCATLYATEGQRIIVLRHGEIQAQERPLVRIHSACLTSEALGSTRCDCREQLEGAMQRIGAEGAGLLLYFLDHEGRGIGLEAKLQAYALQDAGHDTTSANLALGHPVDNRSYALATCVLEALGVTRLRLLTNNPLKLDALTDAGLDVERVPLWVEAAPEAQAYLRHKRAAMAHLD